MVLDFEILNYCRTISHVMWAIKTTTAVLDMDRSGSEQLDRPRGQRHGHVQHPPTGPEELSTGRHSHRAGGANESGDEGPNHVGSPGIHVRHSPDKSTACSTFLHLE